MAIDQAGLSLQCSVPAARLLEARPVWLPTLAALAFAVLTAMLGHWQWHKAERKASLGTRYHQAVHSPLLAWAEVATLGEAALYRRVRLQGEFATGYQIRLDNRVLHGQAGYHVVVPLRLAEGGAVLVNRGWQATGGDRRRVPAVAAPDGGHGVEGILVPARSRYLELADRGAAGAVWQNLDLERYRAWFGGELSDWLVLRTDSTRDGLVRDWPPPDLGIARHRSYAVQWFSMCGLIVGLWLYFVVLKRRGAR